MTKSTLVTVVVTALATSFFWYLATSLRSSLDRTWLISSVKVPGRMALDAIAEDMNKQHYVEANRKLDVLRQEWQTFDRHGVIGGTAIGNIMVEFSKLDAGATAPTPTTDE
jgi:hypothetical protein